MADVAQHAGVSVPTVSRVLNGNPKVDPALAERVRASIAELEYTASPLARSLALGKTQTVSVIIPDLRNPTFHEILRGISHAARNDDFHILISDTAEDVAEEQGVAEQTRRRTDGVIMCAPRMSVDDIDAILRDIAPVVLVNREEHAGVPTVSADYRRGLSELLRHLHELGHRKLLYLAGVHGSVSNTSRLEALQTFVDTHPDTVILERPCGVGFNEGVAAVDAVRKTGATAVVAFNDLVAMGLLSGLANAGISVPDEVSVVGFDDIPFAAFTSPSLTTAAVPAVELGERAWEAMRALLRRDKSPDPVLLRPAIRLRRSSGRAAHA